MTTLVTQTITGHGGVRTEPAGGYLFVSLEGRRPSARGARYELVPGSVLEIGSGPSRRWVEGSVPRLELPDPRVSRKHCQLAHRFGRWEVRDHGSKNGTFVQGTRQTHASLSDGDMIRVGAVALILRDTIEAGHGALDLEASDELPGLATLLPAQATQLAEACTVAAADVPVLIVGPTGSGKELVAAAIHARLSRPGPFVPVNCGALSPELLQSELFGHRRGAFSGSHRDHAGMFERAHQGTLFLDELGELPLSAQAQLLRAVQERRVRAVGDDKERDVDVRLLSATNRDLQHWVADERFRADLFARLAGFVVTLPPIEERREDYGGFVALALQRAGLVAQLSARAVDDLFSNTWKGGARSLAHAVVAAAALAQDKPIEAVQPTGEGTAKNAVAELSRQDRELRDELVTLSAECDGNLAEVARRMGKDRKQVRRWIARLGLVEVVEQHRGG